MPPRRQLIVQLSDVWQEVAAATDEQLQQRHTRASRQAVLKQHAMSQETQQRLTRLQCEAARKAIKRHLETPEQRRLRLQADAARKAAKRQQETPEQRITRQQYDAARKAIRRQQETPEERSTRQQYDAARKAMRRKQESLHQHQTRFQTARARQAENCLTVTMPANIEIKARVHDMMKICKIAEELSGQSATVIVQKDIFYNVPSGRLKLRVLQGQPSQLVFYERSNAAGPKRSDFQIVPVPNPNEMNILLQLALGVKGTVEKLRLLHQVGQTRIHIDDVKGLGHFMELEVLLQNDQTDIDGMRIAEDLMQKLEIENTDLIDVAYIDLLSQ